MALPGELPRVLVVHNRYQQAGGEDTVFANEVLLLRSAGCEVAMLEISNDDIQGFSGKIAAALGAVYNLSGRRLVTDAILRTRPDVVHVHNFFPRISPAMFDACTAAGVPAVWTLHNFRIACVNGLLFRSGRPCEDCIGHTPASAVLHRCYRGSALGSAAVAMMIGYHRNRKTWRTKVARFIALTDFARDLVIRAGLPADRVVVKGNVLADPLPGLGRSIGSRKGAVFVGRLSPEKGVDTLVRAWRALPDVPLTILGDGPERAALEGAAPRNVRFLGFRERDEVLRAVAGARALVAPSEWYENFPMTVVEAMALGTPVIASRLGALGSLVTDGFDGLHFCAGDPIDLARVIATSFAEPGLLDRLGASGRVTWQRRMSPDGNLPQLLSIYRDAIADTALTEPPRAARLT